MLKWCYVKVGIGWGELSQSVTRRHSVSSCNCGVQGALMRTPKPPLCRSPSLSLLPTWISTRNVKRSRSEKEEDRGTSMAHAFLLSFGVALHCFEWKNSLEQSAFRLNDEFWKIAFINFSPISVTIYWVVLKKCKIKYYVEKKDSPQSCENYSRLPPWFMQNHID